MRKFKVICLSVSGAGKLMHKSGDVVAENKFEEGDIDRLIQGNYIEEVKGKETKEEKAEAKAAAKEEKAETKSKADKK